MEGWADGVHLVPQERTCLKIKPKKKEGGKEGRKGEREEGKRKLRGRRQMYGKGQILDILFS